MKKPTTRGLKATLSILIALAMIAAAGAPAQATTSDDEEDADAVGFIVPILIDGNGMIHALGGGTVTGCTSSPMPVNCVTLDVEAQAVDASEACENHNGEFAEGCSVTAGAQAEAWNWVPAGELTLEEKNHAGQLDACTWPVQETGCQTGHASQNTVIDTLEKDVQNCDDGFEFVAKGASDDGSVVNSLEVTFEVCYTYTGQSVEDNVPPPGSLYDWIGQQLEPLDPFIDTAWDVTWLVVALVLLAPALALDTLCNAAETVMDTMESRSLDLADAPLPLC